jgi:hypothetical protein
MDKKAGMQQPLGRRRDYGSAEEGSMLERLEHMHSADTFAREQIARELTAAVRELAAGKNLPSALEKITRELVKNIREGGGLTGPESKVVRQVVKELVKMRQQKPSRNMNLKANDQTALDLVKLAKCVIGKKPVNPAFIAELDGLRFRDEGGGEYVLENRRAGYGDDDPNCYEDEDDYGRYEDCMDSFYERGQDRFSDWANPILKKVDKAARKYRVRIDVDTSAEYGTINIQVK